MIETLGETAGSHVVGTGLVPASVAAARAAMDILLHQPELRRCRRPPSAPDGRSCLRLTARANLSSDDLAVIRHALTAVAEVKVRA
ncbi:hypothetical protein HTZ77_27355 [Nonomuraea sp. SMC257]|uniref:Aminotransferase class I/II-fold pyridoxal phosphate-dependent enzyme n=1 Tax=Nonomuraea montanisoli TaxID=2741721 RepID=A0A7Y6M603_9ACTN|nr:hypothetical protein [Nonomuraea montanisoli]NUW35120.1 hypothetical protein [Nonomuraea montanisoli]